MITVGIRSAQAIRVDRDPYSGVNALKLRLRFRLANDARLPILSETAKLQIYCGNAVHVCSQPNVPSIHRIGQSVYK